MKSWLKSGNEGKTAAMSPETLSCVRLDRSPCFLQMEQPNSVYHNFYCKCLKNLNPYALYVESLVLGFRVCYLDGAIDILNDIKELYPLAGLLFIMLNSCAGVEVSEFYLKFKRQHPRFNDVDQMADELLYHINSIGPRRAGTYTETWHFDDYGECWEHHQWLDEYNGERCHCCIYFFLGRDISLIS